MNEKLINIQNKLSVPKNQKNSFGNYNYRSCEDILEALKPLLKEEGLLLTISDELVNIGERYYIKAIVHLYDEDKEITSHGFAREEEVKKGMDSSQITGAASSYARKYALNAMFLIDDTKDSDATNDGKEEKKPMASPENLSSEKQHNLLFTLYKNKNNTEMLNEEKEKIRKLNSKQASDLITKWKEVKPVVVTANDEEPILTDEDVEKMMS